MEERNSRALAARSDRAPAAQASAFVTMIDCESRCVGAELQSDQLRYEFDPRAEGLQVGNGGFLGHLGVALENVSRRACLDHARTRCRGLTQVESARALKMSSGRWSFELRAGLTERTQYSPYDAAFQGFLVGVSPAPWRLPSSEPRLSLESRSCVKRVSIDRVFGDCMVDEGASKWRETLMSAEPLGSDRFEVCADSILARVRGLRPEVAREVCVQEIYEQAHAEGGFVLACAAARWDALGACTRLLEP
jgi:hypothetical protein